MSAEKVNIKSKTVDIALISLFTALTAVCAWISIPMPHAPFTLQLFAVFLCLCMLGGKKGTICTILYVLLGAVGVPVFAGFNGGLGVILGPTGGYIAGFIFSALVFWLLSYLIKPKNALTTFISLTAALIACYAFGSIWYLAAHLQSSEPISFITILLTCVVPYIIPDLVKIVLAIIVSSALKKRINFK